jgi:acetyl esterase/lipase
MAVRKERSWKVVSVVSVVLLGAAACSPNARQTETAQIVTAEADSVPAAGAGVRKAALPDQQMQAVLTELQALKPKPIAQLSAIEARKQPTPADAVKALLRKQGKSTAPEPVGNVTNRTIPGAAGPIPVRIYTPKGAGPFPVVVYYHGGGWVIADLDTYDASPRALTNLTNAVVVSAHYRQGPEHKFPAAHQDAFAAYRWVLANARSLKGDASKVAVAGESAGGNLAAAVAMMARDSGAQMPVHQVLVYPIAGYDLNTPSYLENAEAKPLNKPMMQWFFDKYLRSPEDGKSPLVDLVHANLQGLPPATVITAQIDPLRSEGKGLADALRSAGAEVDYKNYEGSAHEFFGMGAVLDDARSAQQQAASGLKQGFGSMKAASARP